MKQHTRRKIHAIERINALYDEMNVPGISWGELAELYEEIDKIARRAGLVRELRENGVL